MERIKYIIKLFRVLSNGVMEMKKHEAILLLSCPVEGKLVSDSDASNPDVEEE